MLVAVGAVVTAVVLRPKAEPAPAAVPAAAGGSATVTCDGGPCVVLASRQAKGETVELLADAAGGSGKIRFGGTGSDIVLETSITVMGARLRQDSLECVDGPTAACLVRGPVDGGMLGEVLVARADIWRPAEQPYFADGSRIVLAQVVDDDTPEVIVVRHVCSGAATDCQRDPVVAAVYRLGADEPVGCTRRYSVPAQLRGWPDVRVTRGELRQCP
ncbi:hypothetical protein EWH70_17605 [Amycolatopsis suaedae]|uniref:Uncharacterized protein n=2 Tax=Amycolatopsis suaedae TaxID=2510978 RepID=A0A4Q7J5L9_9PSEU|nr:hypothetical protein EWH70_17605 [Amycolatopsis suaedae]